MGTISEMSLNIIVANVLVSLFAKSPRIATYNFRIQALGKCVSKHGLVVAATLDLQFDLALSLLVKACIKLILGLTALLGSG